MHFYKLPAWQQDYGGDMSDDECASVAPYLTLMTEDATQRHHDLPDVFNALRWMQCAGV